MISFESDYNNGAHSTVLQHLIETNEQQSKSYGFDKWSEQGKQKIKRACGCPDAEIFFLTGGTQTNATVIDGMLSPYEGVIAVTSGHINVHESGAIEASGHKVLTLPSHNGKMNSSELENFLQIFHSDPTWAHMVYPGMVYITFPTELGTVYTTAEITQIKSVCQQYNIPLFVDGARLGYGLMSPECDFDLAWLAHHCDAFYIGGTKVGALCGEAVVFPHGNAPHHFFTIVKRHGALLAKSRLVGIQFDALFTDNLYFRISQHAIDMAMKVRKLFNEAGIQMRQSTTNQQFVILSHEQMETLQQDILFETWEAIDEGHTLCRFVTSWVTKEAEITQLAHALKKIRA